MLKNFLQSRVAIKRRTDVIYEGEVKTNIDFEPLTSPAFLSVSVSASTSLSVKILGSSEGQDVDETIEIGEAKSNRGFQLFDSISEITCSGDLIGKMKIRLLSETNEPLFFEKIVGENIPADHSYKPEYHSLEAPGEVDSLRRGYKFYFEPEQDVKEGDVIELGKNCYRVQSINLLRSITGNLSHKEATVSKLPSEQEFED